MLKLLTCMQMDDPRIFPQQFGAPFPANFNDVIRTIFKRLFRVYAHMYHTHFNNICSLNEQPHLNTCFKHFMYFSQVLAPLLLSQNGYAMLLSRIPAAAAAGHHMQL